MVLLFFGIVASAMATRLAWRKQQMEAVQATYRVATEGANEGFYMLRHAGRSKQIDDFEVVDCNERGAAFYGMQRSQMLGTRITQFCAPAALPLMLSSCATAIATGFHEEEFEVMPGGMLRLTWVHRRLVRSGDGLAVTLRDISEVKRHEQQLVRMSRQDVLLSLIHI